MSNSKLDLFEQSWIENVFEGRNKSYGAYELRTNSGKRTLKALAIGAVIFLFLVCIPIISRFISENMGKKRRGIGRTSCFGKCSGAYKKGRDYC